MPAYYRKVFSTYTFCKFRNHYITTLYSTLNNSVNLIHNQTLHSIINKLKMITIQLFLKCYKFIISNIFYFVNIFIYMN